MMDCKLFASLLDMPETEWTADQRAEMEAHAAECRDCATLLSMRREMRAMDDEARLPEGFTASWQDMIRTEAQNTVSEKKKGFPWLRTVAAVAAVAVLAVGTAITYQNEWSGNGGLLAAKQAAPAAEEPEEAEYEYDDYEVYEDYAAAEAPMEAMGAVTFTTSAKRAAGETGGAAYAAAENSDAGETQESKIIRTVNLSIQTRNYQADYDALRRLAESSGGRIEGLDVMGDGSRNSLRNATFTLRIPAKRLDAFIDGAKGIGTVSSYSESSEDITETYYDTRTRLETQQAKMARLTELMKQARDVSDLIELESAISDCQYWIDHYTGQLNRYNSRVSDSYVYVKLRELSDGDAVETKTLTLGERLSAALRVSGQFSVRVLQAMLIFLVAALPWIAALAVVALAVVLIVRRRKKQQKKDSE